jgi:hypothetical protein
MLVDCGSFGLFLGVSASNSTGASQFPVLPTTSAVTTTLYHFCPHLTPNLFVVNRKVAGGQSETDPYRESTRNCG